MYNIHTQRLYGSYLLHWPVKRFEFIFSWFKKKTERMREYLIYLFVRYMHLVSSLKKKLWMFLVSPSWLNWFEWIYYWFKNGLYIDERRRRKKNQHRTVSFMRNSFPLYFFHNIRYCVQYCFDGLLCYDKYTYMYWFGLIHFSFFWGHIAIKMMRYKTDWFIIIHDWIGVWCVFDKSIGLILNDFKFLFIFFYSLVIFSFFIFVESLL